MNSKSVSVVVGIHCLGFGETVDNFQSSLACLVRIENSSVVPRSTHIGVRHIVAF